VVLHAFGANAMPALFAVVFLGLAVLVLRQPLAKPQPRGGSTAQVR
jgi:hypothetical protein